MLSLRLEFGPCLIDQWFTCHSLIVSYRVLTACFQCDNPMVKPGFYWIRIAPTYHMISCRFAWRGGSNNDVLGLTKRIHILYHIRPPTGNPPTSSVHLHELELALQCSQTFCHILPYPTQLSPVIFPHLCCQTFYHIHWNVVFHICCILNLSSFHISKDLRFRHCNTFLCSI